MIETGLNIERVLEAPSLYAGGSLISLGGERHSQIAGMVSTGLAEHSNTMIQYSPEDLVHSIEDKRTACVLDSRGELTAFAQYWPYKVDHTGDEILLGLNVFEIGSWLSFTRGKEYSHGRKVFEACWAIGEMAYPNAGFVAVVEEGNQTAANLVKSMGGDWIGEKISRQVIKPADFSPARMNIFRMIRPGK